MFSIGSKVCSARLSAAGNRDSTPAVLAFVIPLISFYSAARQTSLPQLLLE